ncbi:aspartokinase 3 [Thalassobacillus devorans]|uniref:Aspartokinase n=1 Tax=Thalassobacillus devorans TaxID=279813 RepID=A0ABQ1P506_9BACI|nr:aspartate kinase [Thalassobacillus devorans]NIK29584.1 aspartate kinase [Thalassobacillus devorans]GGC91205.1 aspartokinase 3 [Thalassobacillus devorans]
MKVVKFGGSSVANATQLRKVANIMLDDTERKVVVVSAPGKRFSDDVKMTDLLIELAGKVTGKEDHDAAFSAVMDRFREIIQELELSEDLTETIQKNIEYIINTHESAEWTLDALKSCGEDGSAQILSAYLQSKDVEASYVNPKDAGIIVSDEPGQAQVLDESLEQLYKLRERKGILVIPGFFGYSKADRLVTFPRGGSDITGSIVAAGVKADLYENFTDVDSVYCVNPTIVSNPKQITSLTYKEMRELSYAGFSVFHDEALIPAFKAKIPVCIKNTNNPQAPGTMIVSENEAGYGRVTGIASDKGFLTLYVSKYLMNREIGFGRRLLQILEDEGISFEHAPSGIDDMSVILREDQLPVDQEEQVIARIKNELNVDMVNIERNMAMVMLVGEGMNNTIGLASQATRAFREADVNIEMINQGSSEVSMMFGVYEEGMERVVQYLYEEFFE